MTLAADSVLTCLSLYRALPTATLIAIEEHHGFKRSEILDALEHLILARSVNVHGDSLSLAERIYEEIPAKYLAAADAYRKAKHPTLRDRVGVIIANLWHRLWLHLVFLTTTVFFALGLCAQDVPTWVLRGIAAVETGTDWTEGGVQSQGWQRGAIGEVGPWQLSPAVLRDLKSYDKRDRIHRESVFAESLTRAWLLHLYARTGSWSATVAAYHAGLGRRSESFATTYAERVRAAGIANH